MNALLDPKRTVAETLLENPSRAIVFEQYHIDYCCGGKKPLTEACQRAGVAVETLFEALAACDGAGEANVAIDWSTKPCRELITHIVQTHHEFLRRELPRLNQLADKVAKVHGERAGDLYELAAVVRDLYAELDSHMQKEEQVLFPFVEKLERGEDSPFPTIGAPISCMEHEHDDAGKALAAIRSLTNSFEAPMDACNSWRVLYHGLRELESDLHQHIHKENNVLFPRALAMEMGLREGGSGRCMA